MCFDSFSFNKIDETNLLQEVHWFYSHLTGDPFSSSGFNNQCELVGVTDTHVLCDCTETSNVFVIGDCDDDDDDFDSDDSDDSDDDDDDDDDWETWKIVLVALAAAILPCCCCCLLLAAAWRRRRRKMEEGPAEEIGNAEL